MSVTVPKGAKLPANVAYKIAGTPSVGQQAVGMPATVVVVVDVVVVGSSVVVVVVVVVVVLGSPVVVVLGSVVVEVDVVEGSEVVEVVEVVGSAVVELVVVVVGSAVVVVVVVVGSTVVVVVVVVVVDMSVTRTRKFGSPPAGGYSMSAASSSDRVKSNRSKLEVVERQLREAIGFSSRDSGSY